MIILWNNNMQNINLYESSEERDQIYFKSYQMLTIVGFLIFFLFSISVVKFIQSRQILSKIDNLKQQKEEFNIKIGVLKASLPDKGIEVKLQEQVASLGKIKSIRQRMFQEISRLEKDEKVGFSKYLYALSKYDIEGVWLTSFNFYKGGDEIVLEGKAESAKLIPKLVSKLGEDPVFSGKSFEFLNIYKEKKEDFIKFTLRSS